MENDGYDIEGLESEIVKILGSQIGSVYNAVDSWALVVRAHSNDGDGDRHFGGLFMPPGQDMFTMQGLRWLLEEGIRGRYATEE